MNMKEKLESLGRNSIQLKIARKETYKLGATRFGGKPDVPPDFVWPTYEGESYDHVVKDRPLTFLAQFNCAELAQFDKEHLLPDHGLLSFFYETDTQCWGYDPKDMLATIKSEKEEHGALDIETIRSIDVPSYVSGRSYSHLGEIAKYRKRALDQIIRYAGYLEQIHAPAEYLEQVNVLQESVSDLTIKTKDLKPFRFRL